MTRGRLHRPRARQTGMTMVELLVALGVSLIGLMGLLSLFTAAARANAVAADTAEAIDAASRMIEDLGATSVATLESMPAYGPIDADGWGPVPYHLGDAEGRRGLELERRVYAREVFGSPGLVWLRAEVAWRDPGSTAEEPPRAISLETTMLRGATP